MAIEGVLRTRLLPPRLPPGCVPREQLVTAVEEGLRGRLVAVVAGAGYGKTTLLVLALERSESPWVWCSCDAGLADTRMLLVHLAAGLTGRFPGFGAGLELEGSSEEQVVEVCNEVLDTVPEECVVALDDVHLLPPPAAESLGLLVEHLPPSVHLALAGRMPLPLPLARLRAARVVEIEEGQLAFSLVEAAELVRSVGLELDQEALVHLHRRTEGWPAGLILAALSGEAISEGTPSRAEFDYLAEEVLGRQPTDLQELLLDTAVLGRFSPDLAAAVSGRPDAGELVRRLAAGHLFTARLDDSGDWYRYHHLFQAFLRRRLSDRDPERARERHRRAAAWWQAAGDPAEAVPHFLQAGELDEAVDALEPVAERLALSAHAESLAGWLERIPRERWAARPGLLLAEASLLLASARHEAAFADFERAIERLATAGDHERAAAALFRMQQAMLAAGTSRCFQRLGSCWPPRTPTAVGSPKPRRSFSRH